MKQFRIGRPAEGAHLWALDKPILSPIVSLNEKPRTQDPLRDVSLVSGNAQHYQFLRAMVRVESREHIHQAAGGNV